MSEIVALRRAEEKDAAAIRDLTRAAYAKWVPVVGREPKPMAADYEVAVRNHRFDLLYVDGVLAGLIETVDEKTRLLVENVAVSPLHQARGLGTRLMALAEEIALALGRNRIRLYTNNRWAENVRLYSSLGYCVDSEDEIDGGMCRVNMSKSLRDAR
jgi:GNAT superfamily N-acetyltransferase